MQLSWLNREEPKTEVLSCDKATMIGISKGNILVWAQFF